MQSESSMRPNSKVVAAAVAAIAAWIAQIAAGIDVPPGIEGALAVVVAYWVPSTRQTPLDSEDGHGPPGNLIWLLAVVILIVVLARLL